LTPANHNHQFRHTPQAIQQAAEPFFINYWMQNTHAPVEVPPQYASLYHFHTPNTNTFYGMISVVDEAVGNVTAVRRSGFKRNYALALEGGVWIDTCYWLYPSLGVVTEFMVGAVTGFNPSLGVVTEFMVGAVTGFTQPQHT
jgi:hypothetical protein